MTTASELFDLGYVDLVSIIPPGAQLSPKSNIKPDQLGKVPGRKYSTGWGGYDWRNAGPVSADDIKTWRGGVGLKTNRFPAIDVDCTDPTLAQLIRHQAVMHLGLAPERVGREPKTLLLYRLEGESFGRMRLWIGDDQLVEVLGDGQQFVASGIHPMTGKPYVWPKGLLPADELTPVSRDDLDAFLTALEADADMLGYTCRREGSGAATLDRETIDQDELRGDADKIAEAMAMIPNDNDRFPGRDDYLRMGYALKAALGEDGYELFSQWAARWEGNGILLGNDPDETRADWLRMKPPFEVGAHYIFEVAQEYGYNAAGDEFEASEEEDTPDDDVPGGGGPIQYSDAAIANLFMRAYAAQLKFCPERSAWMSWDGSRWLWDGGSRATYLSGLLCQRMSNQALELISSQTKAESTATRLASTGTKRAVVAYCEDHPVMQLPLISMDADPYLLNTPAGMVDLRDGSIAKHDPGQHMTRVTAVAPSDAPAPEWARFLDEATAGDKELQRYLQRLIGYASTGLKTEHNLAFIYGSGGNGKGVFLNTVAAILGDYTKAASMDTFTASKFDRHPTDMAGLAGARLVTAQETQEGRRWDEQKVKTLTSADKVQARFMREDFFEFTPTFKLVFAGNHKPEIRNLDDAMRRRFHLVPFTHKPKVVDPLLPDKLKAEWPQILSWIIEGARMWMAEGLNPPESVIEATAEYFDEEDPLGQWIKDRVIFRKGAGSLASTELYDNWQEWCGENGEHARSVKSLVRLLKDRGGFRQKRTATFRGFEDIELRTGPHAPAGSEFLA